MRFEFRRITVPEGLGLQGPILFEVDWNIFIELKYSVVCKLHQVSHLEGRHGLPQARTPENCIKHPNTEKSSNADVNTDKPLPELESRQREIFHANAPLPNAALKMFPAGEVPRVQALKPQPLSHTVKVSQLTRAASKRE